MTEEEQENEEFRRTGIFKVKFKVEVKVTEADMVKDLVNNTEGKMIPAVDLDDVQKN